MYGLRFLQFSMDILEQPLNRHFINQGQQASMLCHLHQLPDPCKATAAGQPRRSAMAGITCFWRGHNGGGDVIGFGHPNRSDSKIKGLIGS